MHALRRSVLLTRLVLAWFVLALGVAVAAPVVAPRAMELVCSASGDMRLVVVGEDGTGDPVTPHGSLDCPLCLPAALPPAPAALHFAHASPLAHALRPLPAARIAAQVGAPLPPRGPPAIG